MPIFGIFENVWVGTQLNACDGGASPFKTTSPKKPPAGLQLNLVAYLKEWPPRLCVLQHHFLLSLVRLLAFSLPYHIGGQKCLLDGTC